MRRRSGSGHRQLFRLLRDLIQRRDLDRRLHPPGFPLVSRPGFAHAPSRSPNDLKELIDAVPAGPPGPQGNPGNDGNDGAPGEPFAAAVVDGVTTLDPGQAATVETNFDGSNVRFTFGIPRGSDGGQGEQGEPGEVTTQQLDDAIAGAVCRRIRMGWRRWT